MATVPIDSEPHHVSERARRLAQARVRLDRVDGVTTPDWLVKVADGKYPEGETEFPDFVGPTATQMKRRRNRWWTLAGWALALVITVVALIGTINEMRSGRVDLFGPVMAGALGAVCSTQVARVAIELWRTRR